LIYIPEPASELTVYRDIILSDSC